MSNLKNKYIGDRNFYSMVLAIALPIMIQNGFTNFVSLLDNIMVGRVGTEEMSGVSIANQLIFVFNLVIFGVVSGGGIYGAQYFGKKDNEGIKTTIRFKYILGIISTVITIIVFILYGEKLIALFLTEGDETGDVMATLNYGYSYVLTMLFGLPAYTVSQIYASTLREGGETVLPMKAGLWAIGTNLTFNYLLIYGKCGFPTLGVVGAAIATVMSRYVETAIIVITSHKKKESYPFFTGLYSTMIISKKDFISIFKAAFPIIINETMWSIGMTVIAQSYSTRGLNAVAGYNISSVLLNIFNVTFMAVGSAISIIVGQLLGAGKIEEAVDTDRKLIVFSVMVGTLAASVMALLSPVFPLAYNTTESARKVATDLILAEALCLPLFAFKNATYFTLRSGGRVIITIIFDSAFLWAVGIPTAYIVSRFTDASVVWIYLSVQATDILKCILGFILVKKRIWVRNIVD